MNIHSLVDDLRERFVAKGHQYAGSFPIVGISFWRHSVYVSLSGRDAKLWQFEAPTLEGAVAAARAWLDADDIALANLTLGLTADGRYAEARP